MKNTLILLALKVLDFNLNLRKAASNDFQPHRCDDVYDQNY